MSSFKPPVTAKLSSVKYIHNVMQPSPSSFQTFSIIANKIKEQLSFSAWLLLYSKMFSNLPYCSMFWN